MDSEKFEATCLECGEIKPLDSKHPYVCRECEGVVRDEVFIL